MPGVKVTVTVPLSGVGLGNDLAELPLGEAVIYRNPAAASDISMAPGPNARVAPDPQSRSRPVARLLLQFIIESADGSAAVASAVQAAEKLVLPLRLGTDGQVLLPPSLPWSVALSPGSQVQLLPWLFRGGNQMAERVAVDAAAPMPVTGIISCVLDGTDTGHLSQLVALLASPGLDTFEVPLGLFSGSYYRTRPVDPGVDLVVALEAMFSEGAESIAYKVAFRAACVLESNGPERYKLFRFIKTAYTHRNALVHGGSARKAADWFASNGDQLRGITRRSLLFLIRCLRDGVKLSPEKIDRWLFASGRMDAEAEAGSGEDSTLAGKCFDVHGLG